MKRSHQERATLTLFALFMVFLGVTTPGAEAAPRRACISIEGYEPRPALRSTASKLRILRLKREALRAGDAYTVWGASYSLRSRAHRADVSGKRISIRGFITKTNLLSAPKCAIHRPGRADPEGCRPQVPTFWIGDRKEASPSDSIRVLGWAANFSEIFGAIAVFDSGKSRTYEDSLWGVELPNPLPAVGAEVTVEGVYGARFAKSASGVEVDPNMGLLSYHELFYGAYAGELATLPGVARKGSPIGKVLR